MRRVAVTGWVLLVVGTLVLGMRTMGFLNERQADRVAFVSHGATIGDIPESATQATATASMMVSSDNAARIGIVTVAIGILLVVLGSPGTAPNERRLIGT